MATFGSPLFNEVLFGVGNAPAGSWTPGALWSIEAMCAHTGAFGLSRIADGVTGDSDTVNNNPISVGSETLYFLAFWLKNNGSADGTIGLGLKFYDAGGTLLSEEFVTSTAFSTSWTAYTGVVTSPLGAVSAVVTVRATGHLTGIWCVDDVYCVASEGRAVVSSLKHYFSEFCAYR